MEYAILIGAAIAFIKFLRSDTIKQLGPFERLLVVLAGGGLVGAGIAVMCPYSELRMELWCWFSLSASCFGLLLGWPWILKPINDAHKEQDERINAALHRTDEPFASKRNAILERAETNNYASDEQLNRDVKHLGIMLGDEERARWLINHLLEKSVIYQEDEEVEVGCKDAKRK